MTVIVNSTFDVNTDHHVVWFGCTVVQDTGDFHTGSGSLLITADAAFGSGAQLDNYPYYSGFTAGSSYDFSIWYKEAVATMPAGTWNLRWEDSGVVPIRTDVISLPRATSWTQATGRFTAPTGTVTLAWDFQFSTGAAGPALSLDDLLIQDAPAASFAPPPPGLLVSRLQPYFG